MKLDVSALITVFWHTAVIYLYLNLSIRFFGKRILGQLTVIDLVVVMLLGSAVETAMVAGNTTLPAGIVCASTLMLMNRLAAFICARNPKWEAFTNGSPVVLIKDGQILEENMRRSELCFEEVIEAIRERGCESIADVKYAVLEADGQISVVTGKHVIKRAETSLGTGHRKKVAPAASA